LPAPEWSWPSNKRLVLADAHRGMVADELSDYLLRAAASTSAP
jgi:hypothetical protein